MSGGRWDYGRNLEDNAEALRRLTAMNEVMQAIEHEVDWGVCDDTCSACAKLRIISALEQFFDDRSSDPVAAIAIARDHLQNRCPKCVKQYCLVCGYSYTSAGSCSNSKCASRDRNLSHRYLNRDVSAMESGATVASRKEEDNNVEGT